MNKEKIRNLLKKYLALPKKRLGQHFLIDKKVLVKIIKAAQLKPGDIVLEIGPGIGNLTLELAKIVKKVIAIEKDPKMIEILKETVVNFKNVDIIQGDILKIKLEKKYKKYKVVANLPYYIVSPVIRKFLESKNHPLEMILMVQKEVAQRISAQPPKMNLLAISVQFYAQPKIISFVSKNSFWPRPKVDSAIIKIAKIKKQKSKISPKLFFQIVKAGFGQPRKQLINNFSKNLKLEKGKVRDWLLKNKISPNLRAQNLCLKDWLFLARSFPLSF